ncbi:MAG: adenylate/guanylate cyclase domain-containing protein [Patescibacteria group bacterium]
MKHRSEWIRPIAVGGFIGILSAAGLFAGVLNTWSMRVTDRLFLAAPADRRIVIVAIDDASLGQIGRWPWPRTVHAKILHALTDAGAKAIGYDVNFPESSNVADDNDLAEALKHSGRVVLPLELQLKIERGRMTFDPTKNVSPITSLSSAAAATGHSNTPPDADGTVRRVPLSVRAPDGSRVPAFVTELLRLGGFERDLGLAPLDSNGRLLVNFSGAPFSSFRTLSAGDIFRGTANIDSVKNAIVLVGSTAADLHDSLLVPTSYGIPMPGIEIHASIAHTIISHRWLQRIPPWISALELVLLGLLIGFLFSRIRVRWSVPILLLLWIAQIVSAFALFDRGWIAEIVWPTILFFFAAAAVTLERRIIADRERRELKHALSKYVSPSVVEAILKDPSRLKLGGERRRMSVLFSDIRGFTTISEGMTPEKLVQVLNVYLNRMTNLVFAQNGVLDKYIGDAVMAFWNAPLDQPEHATLAVATALDMRDALLDMNRAQAFGDLELHIGLGVNTGDMVVGNVGGESRFDYTVIGDHVNLASRLEGLTKEYHVDILITEATMKDLAGEILTRRLDKVAVKGKSEPIVIYEAMERLASAGEPLKLLARDFEAALEAYFRREFQDVVTRCERMLSAHPGDGPSKNLLERAKQFIESPPPDAWDGTWVYTKK